MRFAWIISLLLLSATVMAEPSLEVSANRNRLYIGESLLLEVKVGGSAQPETPDLSGIKNSQINFLGSIPVSHQSISIINGQMRREGFTGRVFQYTITPTQTGDITVGPLTVQVDGTTLSHPGPTVTVTGVTHQDIVSISVIASSDTVLVDEPFDIRLAVRIRKLTGPYVNTDPLFPQDPPNLNLPFMSAQTPDGLQGPDVNQMLNERLIRDEPGFSINDYTIQPNMFDFGAMFNGQSTPARFKFERQSLETNGIPYWEYSLNLRYTPQSEANHTFGPVLFKGRVPTTVHQNGSAAGTDIFAVGPAAIVRVMPPPEKDRPNCYIGAIGPNLKAESTLDTQTCNVGDPLTLTLSISGPVQLNNLFPPKLSLQTNLMTKFDIYDDTVKTTRNNGTIQFAYTLRPRQAGAFELPPVNIAYYDTSNRQYRVVTTAPVPLKVRQATEITASQIIGGSTNQAAMNHHRLQAAMAPAGIRLPPSGAIPIPLINHAPRWLWTAGLSPILFLGSWSLRTLYRRRGAMAKAVRRRRALTKAKHLLRQSPPASAGKALHLYLEQRLDVPSSSLTPSEARRLLINHQVPPEIADAFASAMQHHVDVAFASTQNNTTPALTIENSLTALHAVDKALAHPSPRSPRNTLLAPALLLSVLASPLFAATDPEHDFIWNEANATMASAQTPSTFLTAAATYQKLVDLGVRNPDLFFNQGTALLLADKPDDAIQVLLRSERYTGRQPDLTRNLAIAYGKSAGMKTPLTPWSRIVLFWHHGWSCSARATTATIAFTLIWCIAALRLTPWRRGSNTLLWLAIIIFITMGTSVLTTVTQESRAHRPPALRPLSTSTP